MKASWDKQIKIQKARERVIKAAKSFHKVYIGSEYCNCPDDKLYQAVDSLLKLEGK